MDLSDLLTLGGLATAVTAVFEIGKRMLHPAPAILDRFGALIAIGIGVVLGGAAALLQGVDVVPAVVTGILAGLSSIGIYKAAP